MKKNDEHGKYRTIIIDPPWTVRNNFRDLRFYRMGKPMQYSLMSDNEIMDFPINSFAANNCDLFLWAITSKIPLCFKILENWKFRYVDFIAWDKEIGTPVNGIYRKVEWVIYAYRGKMGINKRGKFIPSLIREKRTYHSRKPNIFYEILRDNTHEPRIDIFAREKRDGFDGWGNEYIKETLLTKDIIKHDGCWMGGFDE